MFSLASIIPLRKAVLDFIHSFKEIANHAYWVPDSLLGAEDPALSRETKIPRS